jgi:hypothetical protein
MRKACLLIAFALLAVAAFGQSLNQEPAAAATESTFSCFATFSTGAGPTLFKWCVTQNGNVVSLESPAGVEHIYEGSITEGFGVCDLLTKVEYYDYAQIGAVGFGMPIVTQPNGANTLPLTITRRTEDGLWTLVQSYAHIPAERILRVTMRLENNAGFVKRAYLARFVDIDANSANGGDFQNWFDATLDTISAWNAGKFGADLHTVNPEIEHYTGLFFFNTFLHPCEKPVTMVPVFGDYAGYVTHELSVSPHRSKTITVEYRVH